MQKQLPQPQQKQAQPPQPKKSLLSSAIGKQTGSEPDPKKQRQYNAVGAAALKMVHGKETRDSVLARLSKGDPVAAAGQIAGSIISKIHVDSVKNGVQLDGDVLAVVADEVVRNLAEVASAAGIKKFDEDDKQAALYIAADAVMAQQEKDGTLDLTGVEEITGIEVPDNLKRRQTLALENRAAQEQEERPQAGLLGKAGELA